jgi:hypothetical protein
MEVTMTALRKPIGIAAWQIRRIHALALGKEHLAWQPEDYRIWLMDAFNVSSSKELDYAGALAVITALEQLLGHARRSRPSAAERLQAWNESLFSAHALRGICAIPGQQPPARRLMRHVAGMLWELARDARKPEAFAGKFIADALKCAGASARIETQEQCELVRSALRKRAHKQGLPDPRRF